MKKVIYTVITGGCDKLREPVIKAPGWDWVCFTDNPELISKGWQIRLINENHFDSKKISRKIKILPHFYLSEYDLSLYIDSYILLFKNPDRFLDEVFKGEGFLTKSHPRRSDIYQEAARIIESGKADKSEVLRQVSEYKSKGFNYGMLYENGILLRRHNLSEVIKINEAWWAEIKKHTYRDQLSLPYVVWKNKFKIGTFSENKSAKYFSITSKLEQSSDDIRIFEGTPYGADLQYGKALNEFCSQAPDDSWIIIRDRDTMYLTDNGQQLIDIARKYPDTGVFGVMTNRLGLNWQLVEGMFNECNLNKHIEKANELKERFYDDVEIPGLPAGGLFLMFKKSTWEQVKFREGEIINLKDNKYFDWDFCERVQRLKLPIRIMKGVYLFHLYRWGKNVRNVDHILKKNKVLCQEQ